MADQRPTIIWLNALLITLTSAAVCSRAGRRIIVVRQFSWHDGLITFAAVAAIIFSVFQLVGTNLGLGAHQVDVNPANMPAIGKLVLVSNVFYFTCNWAVKHALLLFYSEITREKSHQTAIYTMHFVAFAFGSSSILVDIFQCRPIHKAWDSNVPGTCVDMGKFFYFNSNFMLFNDLILYIMPVVFTWKLQLRRPQRIGLNCLFALGGLITAASAARVYSVHLFNTKPDFSWRFANAMIWSVIENHIAVVVACAPSIKVIALLIFPRLGSSLNKILSKVTPSNSSRFSRSRSRASVPLDIVDLESGTRKSSTTIKSMEAGSGKLRPTPLSTPLPSPALPSPTYSAGSRLSGRRVSKGFVGWFKGEGGPKSPRLGHSEDSLEDTGLVFVEDVEMERRRDSGKPEVRNEESDIRVEHTISIERD